MMDDVLVFEATQREHDLRLEAVLDKISRVGVTLNLDKCQFSTDSVKFLGHSIDGAEFIQIQIKYMLFSNCHHQRT